MSHQQLFSEPDYLLSGFSGDRVSSAPSITQPVPSLSPDCHSPAQPGWNPGNWRKMGAGMWRPRLQWKDKTSAGSCPGVTVPSCPHVSPSPLGHPCISSCWRELLETLRAQGDSVSIWAMSSVHLGDVQCPHTARCGTGTLLGTRGSAASLPDPATPFPGPFPFPLAPSRSAVFIPALSAALNLISCSSGVGALGGEGESEPGGLQGGLRGPAAVPGVGKPQWGLWGRPPGPFSHSG